MSERENQYFWNGRLIGNPQAVYHRVINYDIVPQSYSDKKKRSGFAYAKRKGYKKLDFNLEGDLEKYSSWLVTHIESVGKETCSETTCTRFFYLVNPSQSLMTVLYAECDCNGEVLNVCQIEYSDGDEVKKEFSLCECAPQEFFSTDFVRGKPRELNSGGDIVGSDGVQINFLRDSNVPPEGRFGWNQEFAWQSEIMNGDYVYVNGSRNLEEDGYCGQVRQVLGWDSGGGDDNYLRVSSPWLGFAPGQEEGGGLTFSILPEWGKVVGFYTRDGLYLIHHADPEECESFVTLVCDYGTSLTGTTSCASSIVEHNGRVNILFENGYNAYGQLTFNKFFFTTDQQTYLGPDKFTIASFRNFLVGFGKNTASVTVFQGNDAQTYELVTNVGLFSSRSFQQFDNSFYFIGSDKRIHPLSIKADGNTYIMDLDSQGMSDEIKGQLDLIKETDEVYLQADGRKLYIFINGSNGEFSGRNTKTLMLIFDRDYGQWTEHSVCCSAIRGEIDDLFYGDGVYLYCGDTDCDGQYFTAKMVAYIGDEEDNGMEFNLFRRKKLNWAKIALGRGIYTNGNTLFKVVAYNTGYRWQYVVDNIEDNKWIKYNNMLAKGEEIEPDECVQDGLAEGAVFDRPCPDSARYLQDKVEQDCGCPDEDKAKDNYCACYDDKGYFLSDTYVMKLPFLNIPHADLYRVEIESRGGDRMVFGGMIAGLYQEDWDTGDSDMRDLWSNESC